MKNIKFLFLVAITMALTGCSVKNKLDIHVKLGIFTPYEYYPEILSGRVIMVEEKLATEVLKGDHPEEGRVLQPVEISEMGMSPDYTAYFDTTGMIIKVVYPGKIGANDKYWLIENKDGRYTRADWITNDSTSIYDTFTYNSDGYLSEKKKFNAFNHSPLGREAFKYNQKGEVTEHDFFNPDGSQKKKVNMTWDENNHVTKMEFRNSSDSLIYSVTQKYNDEGFVSNKKIMDASGNIKRDINYSYEYDVMGNWVSKTIDDGVKKFDAVRTYTYR